MASWCRQTRQPPVFALPRLESRYHRHGRRVPCIRSEEARKSREFYPRGISIRFSRGPEVHGLSLDFRDLHKKNSPGTGPASTTMRSTRHTLSKSDVSWTHRFGAAINGVPLSTSRVVRCTGDLSEPLIDSALDQLFSCLLYPYIAPFDYAACMMHSRNTDWRCEGR